MATQAVVLGGVPSLDRARIADSGRRRFAVGGVLVDRVDLRLAVDRIAGFLGSGRAHQVVTVNLDFLSIAGRDPTFRATINQADLAVADGMPLVWLSRLGGEPLDERVAGVELVHECCRLAAATGVGVFLLGAAPGVASTAAAVLEQRHPGLRVVGSYSPSYGALDPEEDARILEKIAAARPGFLFVALGAPRQDLWIREHLARLDVPVAMGVGCVLDLLAGNARRAPSWMRASGLEWAFRLAQEPSRLWRRYLLDDVPTLTRLLAAALFGGDEMAIETGRSLRDAAV